VIKQRLINNAYCQLRASRYNEPPGCPPACLPTCPREYIVERHTAERTHIVRWVSAGSRRQYPILTAFRSLVLSPPCDPVHATGVFRPRGVGAARRRLWPIGLYMWSGAVYRALSAIGIDSAAAALSIGCKALNRSGIVVYRGRRMSVVPAHQADFDDF